MEHKCVGRECGSLLLRFVSQVYLELNIVGTGNSVGTIREKLYLGRRVPNKLIFPAPWI
jgi:hypothetical protein